MLSTMIKVQKNRKTVPPCLLLTLLGKMCILFIYNGGGDVTSDYRLVVAMNRDEQYDRPTKNLGVWSEDSSVIGGRDLESGCDGGTWLALSPLRKKIGFLLNLPSRDNLKPNAKTRGKLVADFVKSETTTKEYVKSMKSYAKECNEFIFVTIELSLNPKIQTYTNASDELTKWDERYLGFGNSLPDTPLQKVNVGTEKLEDICRRLNRIEYKNELIEELLHLLKCKDRCLPDPELERTRPENIYKELSSIYVSVPEKRYGTRTHTIILLTKSGQLDVIEVTMPPLVDLQHPKWKRTEMQFIV